MLDTDVYDQSALKPDFVTTRIGTVQLAWITPLSKCVSISEYKLTASISPAFSKARM